MIRPYLPYLVLICVLISSIVTPIAVPASAQIRTNNSSNSAPRSASTDTGAARTPVSTNVSSLRTAQINRSQNATSRPNENDSIVDGVTGTAEGVWNSATPNVPSTEQIANNTAEWTKNATLNATQGILETAMQFTVGTVHPKNNGPNGIFGTPTNQPYKNLYQAVYGPISFQYAVLILLLLLFVMVAVMPYAGLAGAGTYQIVRMGARLLAALVFIMFWWPIGTALMQFSDAIAISIAPSPEELTTSLSGLFKLSLGPIVAALSIIVIGAAEVLALAFTYAFRQAALIVAQFAMPLLFVFAYAGPHRRVRSIASTIAWQYFALLTMTIPTAFFMRVGFEAEWGFGFSALGNAIISMALLGLALATPFVFSVAAFRAPSSLNSLAFGAAGAAAGAAGTAREHLPNQVKNDYEADDNQETEYVESTQYIESTQVGDRVASANGGTNYSGAAATGPGPAPGDALPGDRGVSAERIRDFERQTNGQNGGSAAAKTQYHDESTIIDVEGSVIDEVDR